MKKSRSKQEAQRATARIPPAVVELALLARLKAIAKSEGRTLSDVIRCAIRDGLDHRGVE